jgi:hypothetical protein
VSSRASATRLMMMEDGKEDAGVENKKSSFELAAKAHVADAQAAGRGLAFAF